MGKRMFAVCLLFCALWSFCAHAEESPVLTAGAADGSGAASFFSDTAAVTEDSSSKNLNVVLDEGEVALTAPGETAKRGELLGSFTTTGFCTCSICSGGQSSGLTASGTRPKARHTIAADTSRFPFGTRLMIDGVVYTVEDEGSGVQGDCIDIYYDNHANAVAHGTKYGQAVYAVAD